MEEPASKSQKKRDAEALQKLGLALADLSSDQLKTMPLSSHLTDAILVFKQIRSHGAKRRQAQLIGKLMRSSDSELIAKAYEQLLAEDRAQSVNFQQIERWRERLLSEGRQALTAFMDLHPEANSQQLHQLIRKAMDDEAKQRNTGASKALFRYLRSVIS